MPALSPGARFRLAVAEERPLPGRRSRQRDPRAARCLVRLPRHLPLRRRRRRGLARPAGPGHDHPQRCAAWTCGASPTPASCRCWWTPTPASAAPSTSPAPCARWHEPAPRGLHLEDQVQSKRCGHRPGKAAGAGREMCDRLKAAVDARTDASFVIMARTDAHRRGRPGSAPWSARWPTWRPAPT